MIKSRKEILQLNNCFSAYLKGIQEAKYGSSEEWQEGQSVILDDSHNATVLTKEQADKLNAEDLKFFLDNKDTIEITDSFRWVGGTTIASSKQNARDYFSDISNAFNQLTEQFGPLIIIGDWNTPWLSQKNDYPPVKSATEYLSNYIDDNFNGGFELTGIAISEFIPHLFWLTRCNASLPEFVMSFASSKTVFNICKYGVLHLEFYDDAERTQMLKHFGDCNFREVETCSDPVEFDNFDGREIVVSN